MTKIIGVRFKPVGKMYYFDPLDLDIKRGMHVIVETSHGVEYGEVTLGVKEVDEAVVVKPLKSVLRIATDEDTERYKDNKEKEKEAYRICLEKIADHHLDMKLIEVEYTFDGSKILFYFTADGRVDFRELVKDLAAVFRTRIELRQIGVRDESKTLGSIGVCGRNLCCSQFLGEFVPVSIKMAKEQGLSLNPSKISGACGRLMCCLKYEQDTYEELIAESPKVGSTVNTPEGEGTVASVALLQGRVKVRFEKNEETVMKDFDVSEITPPGEARSDAKPEAEILPDMMVMADSFDEPKPSDKKKHQHKNNRYKQRTDDNKDKKPKQSEKKVKDPIQENKGTERKGSVKPNRTRRYKKRPHQTDHKDN